MAVYTHVPEEALRAFLSQYEIGDLIGFEGISQGVENTNYFIDTTAGRHVLTLFEKRVNEADLPFFLSYMRHLYQAGLPVPAPLSDRHGQTLKQLCGRPATIVTFLAGQQQMTPTIHDCGSFGQIMAQMHLAASNFSRERKNSLSIEGWQSLAEACASRSHNFSRDIAATISSELSFLKKCWPIGLPGGVIHADLFPDNVFFAGGAVSGVIDFYFSCTDYLAYDLAIGLNAWSAASGSWSRDHANAIMQGYNSVRPLQAEEIDAMPLLLRGSALRFLLTRLYDWQNQVEGAVVTVKDPLEYLNILELHQKSPSRALYG